jgi:phosphatidylserine decarboxylase
MVADLIVDMLWRDEGTGLYGEEADGGHEMKEFRVPLLSSSGRRNIILLLPSGESLNKKLLISLVVNVRLCDSAKYQPYNALRQQFWRQYLK